MPHIERVKEFIKKEKSLYSIDNIGSDNFDIFNWPILTVGLYHPNPVQDFHPFAYSSKNAVFSIQPLSGCKGEEELAAVCVRSSIGHCHNTSTWHKDKWDTTSKKWYCIKCQTKKKPAVQTIQCGKKMFTTIFLYLFEYPISCQLATTI